LGCTGSGFERLAGFLSVIVGFDSALIFRLHLSHPRFFLFPPLSYSWARFIITALLFPGEVSLLEKGMR
jgi:hypothetical protein